MKFLNPFKIFSTSLFLLMLTGSVLLTSAQGFEWYGHTGQNLTIRKIYTTPNEGEFHFAVRANSIDQPDWYHVYQSEVGPELYERLYTQILSCHIHQNRCEFGRRNISAQVWEVNSFTSYR